MVYRAPHYRFARLFFALAATFIAVTLLVACGQSHFQEAPTEVKDFRGKLIDGGISSYQVEKGKVTLIVLTASWCPGCRQEIPRLKNLDRVYGDKGFKILLINEDDSPQAARRYYKANKIDWTTFHWNHEIMNALGNPGVIPVSYLVDSQNKIVQIDVGEFDEFDLQKKIRKHLED